MCIRDRTANALTGMREEYLKLGFRDYLAKPIQGNRLEKLLIKYLPSEKVSIQEDEPAQLQTLDKDCLLYTSTSSISFLPAMVALIWVNSTLVVFAMTLASVVFPVPGGP